MESKVELATGGYVSGPFVVPGEGGCTLTAPTVREPTSYQISILVGLNRLGKHVFGGLRSRHSTESPRATRRRKARVTKASRRANR